MEHHNDPYYDLCFFLIYINDISNSNSLNLLSFADDTTTYQSDDDIYNLTKNKKIYTIGMFECKTPTVLCL